MTTDIDILRNLIVEESIVEVQQENDQSLLNLEEREVSQGKRYSVKINNPPNDCIAIKSDRFRAPREFFQNKKGLLSRADYILISHRNNKSWIIFIELKSGRGDSTKIVRQLKGSECLLEYCRSIGRGFWNQPSFLDYANYQKLFVCFHNIKSNIPKKPTRLQKGKREKHCTPEKRLTLTVSEISFKKLLWK